MKKLPFYIYVFLLGVVISQAVYYYPVMPDWMASHFEGSGRADNFASKEAFFTLKAIIILFTFGIFIVMPWCFQKFRLKKMNLPNSDYWLAPERIDEVYSYFRASFCWFGVVNLSFIIGVMQLVFSANLKPNPVLNNNIFFVLLGSYFVFTIIWLVKFYRKFKKIN